MRRTKTLFLISLGCAGIAMALLLTAVLITHLLANRDMVKAFIVTKTAQATGGTLVYDRLDISFLPLPHLVARDIRLSRPDAFEVSAQELSVYPRIRAILMGRISVRRVALVGPDIKLLMGSAPLKAPVEPQKRGTHDLAEGIRKAIGGVFGGLAAVDPGIDLRIEQGTLTLAFAAAPDLLISAINASAENADGELSLNLHCRSDITGKMDASATADVETAQASGQITLSGLNVRPLLFHAALPGGITTGNTLATADVTFTVDGSESVHSRFKLQFPSLTVMRKDLNLDLTTVAIAGSADYAASGLSVSIDTLKSAQPALALSAAASITPTGDSGDKVVEVHATAGGLDVAVAAAVTRAIAGDLEEIQTAFSVARRGNLTDAAYFAAFETGGSGLRLTTMKASGRLTQGLVTLPGIEADLEGLEGDVVYEDQRVEFKNITGSFKGAVFKGLDAAIDWEREATLAISSRSVAVDAAPLYTWLTGFKGLDEAKNHIATAAGSAQITKLKISGPLTEPQHWSLEIAGTPEAIRITSPRVPFEVMLSGGKITYLPGNARAEDVSIAFLDGSFVSSFQSKGIVNPESAAWRIAGSMGPAAVGWLSTILPIPQHLQIKPPVALSGVTIAWSNTRTLTITGGIKTADGVELLADVSVSPQEWHVRRLQFADGSSRATVTARQRPTGVEVSFSGNLEKETADHLLENNRTLSGRLEGDLRAVIDTRTPLNSSFAGRLAGRGLHINDLVADPIAVNHFSIEGSGNQLRIAPSQVSLRNSLLVVDGLLDNRNGNLTVDLNVEADRLDEELIRTLERLAKGRADAPEKSEAASTNAPRGEIHVKAADFIYGGLTWSQVQADVRIDGRATAVDVHQANLCGIAVSGTLAFSPRGASLHITPRATGASLQETAGCLWPKPVKATARYDLTGEINLPPTRENPVRFISGTMEFSSNDGRIEYAGVLMKIFSVLNVTEVFTGGKSDLTEAGYGYTKAYAKADIAGGKLQFSEILLDGNSLKLTGQGTIALDSREADITLLAAPLKTIDRIVDKVPIVNYIAGGSLISIPLRLTGPIHDIKVSPMSPSAVGKGVLNLMERTLKAPFKLVHSVSEFAVEELSRKTQPPAPSP